MTETESDVEKIKTILDDFDFRSISGRTLIAKAISQYVIKARIKEASKFTEFTPYANERIATLKKGIE